MNPRLRHVRKGCSCASDELAGDQEVSETLIQ